MWRPVPIPGVPDGNVIITDPTARGVRWLLEGGEMKAIRHLGLGVSPSCLPADSISFSTLDYWPPLLRRRRYSLRDGMSACPVQLQRMPGLPSTPNRRKRPFCARWGSRGTSALLALESAIIIGATISSDHWRAIVAGLCPLTVFRRGSSNSRPIFEFFGVSSGSEKGPARPTKPPGRLRLVGRPGWRKGEMNTYPGRNTGIRWKPSSWAEPEPRYGFGFPKEGIGIVIRRAADPRCLCALEQIREGEDPIPISFSPKQAGMAWTRGARVSRKEKAVSTSHHPPHSLQIARSSHSPVLRRMVDDMMAVAIGSRRGSQAARSRSHMRPSPKIRADEATVIRTWMVPVGHGPWMMDVQLARVSSVPTPMPILIIITMSYYCRACEELMPMPPEVLSRYRYTSVAESSGEAGTRAGQGDLAVAGSFTHRGGPDSHKLYPEFPLAEGDTTPLFCAPGHSPDPLYSSQVPSRGQAAGVQSAQRSGISTYLGMDGVAAQRT
ncbi:hypothetical protein CSOJ01_11562 [Colletotrichum sojae]|uniref:Uncharacterized protein n=1 Tax=Colletotrichum sojae TaxID=2175907 RepID=A0A8H6MNI0_9PEZI|nr:hypothetical protein CSOJ01_11562 [Colletotrichum sojae]